LIPIFHARLRVSVLFRLAGHRRIRRYPHVGLSVARRTTRARRPAGMAGRPGRAGWVVQRWVISWRCQRRMVAGVRSSPRRRRAGSSRVRAASRARSVARSRARGASLEHGELVAQDQDLDVLGGLGSGAQHDPAEELGEHLVGQPQRHRGIMPGPLPRTNGQVRGCLHSFGHPQALRVGCVGRDEHAGALHRAGTSWRTGADQAVTCSERRGGPRRAAQTSQPHQRKIEPERTARIVMRTPRTAGNRGGVHAVGTRTAVISR
jgi:hypothetical protein